MIDKNQLIEFIIRPSLYAIDAYSLNAEQLLLGTCAQESKLGKYIKQVKGPAMGIYQMEPATHQDLFTWMQNTKKWPSILSYLGNNFSPHRLIYDLRYATIFARLFYLRIPEQLPEIDHIENMGKYWKKYYNTEAGKGKVEDFIKNWNIYIVG